jgi:hypothetical protein
LKHAKTPLTAGDRGEPMGLIMGEPRRGIEIRSRNTRGTGESDTRSRSHGFSVSHGEILPHSNLYALDTMNADEGAAPKAMAHAESAVLSVSPPFVVGLMW